MGDINERLITEATLYTLTATNKSYYNKNGTRTIPRRGIDTKHFRLINCETNTIYKGTEYRSSSGILSNSPMSGGKAATFGSSTTKFYVNNSLTYGTIYVNARETIIVDVNMVNTTLQYNGNNITIGSDSGETCINCVEIGLYTESSGSTEPLTKKVINVYHKTGATNGISTASLGFTNEEKESVTIYLIVKAVKQAYIEYIHYPNASKPITSGTLVSGWTVATNIQRDVLRCVKWDNVAPISIDSCIQYSWMVPEVSSPVDVELLYGDSGNNSGAEITINSELVTDDNIYVTFSKSFARNTDAATYTGSTTTHDYSDDERYMYVTIKLPGVIYYYPNLGRRPTSVKTTFTVELTNSVHLVMGGRFEEYRTSTTSKNSVTRSVSWLSGDDSWGSVNNATIKINIPIKMSKSPTEQYYMVFTCENEMLGTYTPPGSSTSSSPAVGAFEE